jgi:hypothetical protein
MIEKIPEPIAGKSIINWALPVTRAINSLPDKIGASARNERNRTTPGFLHPYTVKWSKEKDKLLIYLPYLKSLYFSGSRKTIGGVTSAADEYGTDWFTIKDSSAESTDVFLGVFLKEDDDGNPIPGEFDFATITTQESTLQPVKLRNASIRIAQFWGDAGWQQYVTSAIMLGGGGGGGSCNCPDDGYPADGTTKYKTIVLDPVSWDESDCKLVIPRAKIGLRQGLIVSWEDLEDAVITTVSLSDIVGA